MSGFDKMQRVSGLVTSNLKSNKSVCHTPNKLKKRVTWNV